MAVQAVPSQPVSCGTTETMINPDYAGLYRTMANEVRQNLAERGFERVRPQSCRAVVRRPRNGLATVIWPIAALAGREWPGSRIEAGLFPEPFRGSEAAVNPGARTVGATAPRGPCKARAFALQRACNGLAIVRQGRPVPSGSNSVAGAEPDRFAVVEVSGEIAIGIAGGARRAAGGAGSVGPGARRHRRPAAGWIAAARRGS